MANIRPFPGIQQFLFEVPLYDVSSISDAQVESLVRHGFTVDGHCPDCGRSSTFRASPRNMTEDEYGNYILGEKDWAGELTIRCSRDRDHSIEFNLLIINAQIQKVGQYPSFADIANDESKQFSTVLDKGDANELHKAIGLAAHGVGIGAYVYIRRIFERLIHRRFEELKDANGWDEADFMQKRMTERIEFLRGHLPSFLVDNKRPYSIVSLGIHELSEQECLAFFEILRHSVIFILEEDRQAKERATLKTNVEKAIAQYNPPKKTD